MSAQQLDQREISLSVKAGEEVSGDLVVPPAAAGIVVFAHGSGSSRHSPRNRSVASALQEAGFATLLFDLLTADEERRDEVTAELRFDIPFLASRLLDVIGAVRKDQRTMQLPVGLFGASTGAAAALVAAASDDAAVSTVISRGGRPDLAGRSLRRVTAPTLLIVGGLDREVIELNRSAFETLGARDKQLVIVPGASHLFEEPGKLEEVARLAADWCQRWLR